jgi:hypothetical protein
MLTDQRPPAGTVKPTDWRLVTDKPHKKTWMRYDPSADEIVFMEEFYNYVPLKQAAQQRELYDLGFGGDKDFKPVVVIPQSVVSEALRDGWYHDEAKWKRWINDGDNANLRITRGNV